MGLTAVLRRGSPGRRALSVHALALLVLSLSVAHVVLDDDPLWTELLEGAILAAFAAAIFSVGRRVRTEDLSTEAALRIVAIGLGGGAAVMLLAALFVGVRALTNEPTSEAWFVLSIGWSVGAGGGCLVGYYYDRFSTTLADQRDLATRLTVLQRVLRHNLRNEATVIAGAARDAGNRTDDPEVEQKVAMIDRHVRRISELSEKSQQLTRVWRTDETVTFDVETLLREEADRFRADHPEVTVRLEVECDRAVRANPQFRLAIREVFENAAEHNEEVEISVKVGPPERSLVPIEVVDTGGGIPASELAPLRRGGEHPLAHATGLGLWLIYWLVERSGGELEVEAREPTGTVITMWLPAAR